MRAWLDGIFRPAPVPEHGYVSSAFRTYRLPSNLPGAMFTASMTARWLPYDQGRAEAVFAHLGGTGAELTRRFSVLDADVAKDELNTWFAQLSAIPGAGVRIESARAVLEVPDEHRDFARQMAAVERKASADTAGMEATRARLMKIRDTFLRDSPTARLWWSDGEPDKLLRLDGDAVRFETIVNLVSDSPAKPAESDPTASLIDRFLTDLGPDHREYLITQLAKIFESYQRPDLADELRQAR